jgi:hypothetical protein
VGEWDASGLARMRHHDWSWGKKGRSTDNTTGRKRCEEIDTQLVADRLHIIYTCLGHKEGQVCHPRSWTFDAVNLHQPLVSGIFVNDT